MSKPASTYRVVVAGGGTGGHIMPAIAVADKLKALNAEVLFIGSVSGPEAELVKAAGYAFYSIQAGKLRRYFSFANIVDFFKVGIGFLQARNHLARLKPDVVFAKGGYVSVPVAYAARFLEIPVVAHESDVVLGLANRLVADKAELICTGFPANAYPATLRRRMRFTGNPIRSLFYAKPRERKAILTPLELSPRLPIVLMIAGSQGAQSVNELLWAELADSLKSWQFIHITGVANIEEALAVKAKLPIEVRKRYVPMGFVGEELLDYYAVADLVISRSGANTLTELAQLKKATILIPLPSAASDHQRANARIFESKDATLVVEQTNLTASKLRKSISELLENEKRRKQLARNIQYFAAPEASSSIAEAVIEVAKRSKSYK